jgi:hypothetical protein
VREQPNGRRDADDAMARMSNSVMEDHQPVDTDEDTDSTARAGSSNAPESEADPAENLQVEPRD